MPGRAAEASAAKKVANNLKKALGLEGNDDKSINRAADAAAENVMRNITTLKSAAEELVDHIEAMNNLKAPKKSEETAEEIGKITDAREKEKIHEASRKAVLNNPKNAALKKAVEDKAAADQAAKEAEAKKDEAQAKIEQEEKIAALNKAQKEADEAAEQAAKIKGKLEAALEAASSENKSL
mgnify:CR=1 FL=1